MKRGLYISSLVLAIWLGGAGLGLGAVVTFTQKSSPTGIVNVQTTHATATRVTTVTAPVSSSTYRFTHWAINEGSGAYRVNDPYGRAGNPVSFTIYNPSVATANYLPATNDVDADAVPDWYEVQYLGTTTNGASFNADGDGYNLLVEYRRNYNPLFADAMRDGGISRSRSATSRVNLDLTYFVYRRTSEPWGIHNYSAVVTNGTVDLLPELPDSGGYRFAYWSVNGARLADSFGRSLGTYALTVTGAMSVVAHFYPLAADTDTDGVPDWYEWHYFGTLGFSSMPTTR